MHHRRAFHASLLGVVTVCASACAESPDEPSTRGKLQIHTEDGCRGECGVVAKNVVRLDAVAEGALASHRLKAEVSSASSARIKAQIESCKCFARDGKAADVAVDDACPSADDQKRCEYGVDVETLEPGDVTVSFFDRTQKPIDVIPLVVRDPAKLVVSVGVDGPRQTREGRHIVYRGAPIDLSVTVLDDKDNLLRHAAPPWSLASSDEAVVVPDRTTPSRAQAGVLGSATLTVTAGSVKTLLEIDVVER